MKVKNCPQCGSLFIDVGFRVCERCLKYENEQFEIVKEYLQKNAGVTVEQISEATGVSRQLILQFIKAGRLSGSITKLAGPQVRCERCDKPILEGRICAQCQSELTEKLRTSSKKDDNDKIPSKVRFLKRRQEEHERGI